MNTLLYTLSKVLFFISIFLSIFSCSKAQKLDEKQGEYSSKTVEFFNNQNYDSAIYYSDKILEKSPENANVWLTKARSLFFVNKNEESIKAFDKAVELNPQDNQLRMYRGTVYRLNGNEQKALQDFDFILKTDINNSQAIAQKAMIHYRLKQYEKSIMTYDKLLKLDLLPFEKLLNLNGRAKAYIGMQKYDLAEQDIDNALNLGIEKGITLETKILLLNKKENYQEALELAKQNLELAQNHENIELRKEFVPYSYNNLGYQKHKIGNTEEGIKDIMYSLELMPTNSYAYKYLALISFELDKKEEGCQYIEKALELGFTKMFGIEMEELKQEKCAN